MWKDLFEQYLDVEGADGAMSSITVKNYQCGLRMYLRFCDETGVDVVQADKSDIKMYRKWSIRAGKSRATIYYRLVVVRRFYEALIWSGQRQNNPALGIKAPRADRAREDQIQFMTLEQMKAVIKSTCNTLAGARDKVAIVLMGVHGMRSGEVRSMNVRDLEWANKRVLVSGKSGERYIYLRDDVLMMIRRYLSLRKRGGVTSDALLCNHQHGSVGTSLSRFGLSQAIDRAYVRAGVPFSGQHVLRHSAATIALSNGATVEQVQAMLGHKSLDTTSVYVHAIDRERNNPSQFIDVSLEEPDFAHE